MANEKRLIDPTEYKAFLERYIKELYEVDAPMIAGAVERCLRKLEEQPTTDAVEVVHSRAVLAKATNIVCTHKCAICDALIVFNDNYCPNCGAKMDGDGNG